MSSPVRAARRRIERDYGWLLERVDACADEVAETWDGSATTDRDAVVEPLRAGLEESGVLARLPSVLEAAVDATGHDLPTMPVAAPPYVVVTSRGAVLRATIPPGRLVIRFDAFDVARGEAVEYRRLDGVRLVATLA